MEELNTMLADLADDGALESSGVFTLSMDKAEEKLSAYRLVNPGLFVLNLVAAAVCVRAERFRAETRDHRTSFSFNAALEIEDEQLRRLFTTILDPKAPAPVRELALAVHSARALPGEPAIYLTVSTARMCQELVVLKDRIDVVPAPPAPFGVNLTLEYAEGSGWSRLFNRNSARQAQILQNLYHFCRFAPLELLNNGKVQGARITLGVYDQAVFAWRHLRGEQALKVATAERRVDLVISGKTQSPVASSMVIALINTSDGSSSNEGLLLVSRGVVFRRPASILGFPIAQAVVSADHLEKNLSQSDLVEGEAYEALLAVLQAEVEELILEVCTNPPPGWTISTSQAFARALDQRYPSDNAPVPVETFRRVQALSARCLDLTGQTEQMEFWRGLKAKDAKVAEEFGKELAGELKIQFRRALVSQDWPLAAHSRKCLADLQGREPDVLLATLYDLAGQPESARALVNVVMEGFTPALAYLMGWSEELEDSSPISNFLRFQKAAEQSDFALADSLAQALAAEDPTVLLQVWLGGYALYRQHYDEAYRLWDAAVHRMSPREWHLWSRKLWRELIGKVSFLAQVRWGARRTLEEAFRGTRAEAGEVRSDDPLYWALQYWSLRRGGAADKAHTLYRSGIISRLIDMDKLTLRPLKGRGQSLGLFG